MTDFAPDDLSVTEEVSKLADQMRLDTPLTEWRALSRIEKEYMSYGRHERELSYSGSATSADIVMSMRLTHAAYILKEVVEINPDKAHGVPVLAGTRFKIARILAELADGMTVSKISREFDLDKAKIEKLLHGIAIKLDRPFFHE
jgi:uncharacterized protein (DUF433 family)